MPTSSSEEVSNAQHFSEALGEVKGQLSVITQMIQRSGDETNRRIEDFRISMQAQQEATNQRIQDHKDSVAASFERLEIEKQTDSKTQRNKTYAGSAALTAVINGFFKALEAL